MSKRVLITGAGGFIGKALVKKFIAEEYEVIGWDLTDNESGSYSVKAIDMTDYGSVKESLCEVVPDIILHCAGCADVSGSVRNPSRDYNGNVTVFHNLMFALHENGMNSVNVVLLSSAAVYGNPQKLPITEDMPVNPLSPYALHKVMCENIANYFVKNYGIDVRIARIFSAYGRGLKKQIFWDMYTKYQNKGELRMFGTGDESRDYIHISDLANALFLIACSDKSKHIIYNVANGEEITIKKAVETFAASAKIDNEYISFNGEGREGDPKNWCANIDRLLGLGYIKRMDFKTGINDYVTWLKG